MLTAFINPLPLRHPEAGESLFAGSAVEKRSGEQREEVAWPSRKSRLVPCGCLRMYKVKFCCCQLLNNIQVISLREFCFCSLIGKKKLTSGISLFCLAALYKRVLKRSKEA